MSPLFGRSRNQGGPTFDPALDDEELAAARDDAVRGRWEAARYLLAATATDWDRRSHRLAVLAEAVATSGWDEDWLAADPDNPDANALHAYALALRVTSHKVDPQYAEDACDRAVAMAPDDPVPWIIHLVLARVTGNKMIHEFFDEVRRRSPYHRDGFHALLGCLVGPKPANVVESFRLADWAAEMAPPGSPLALLPLTAHAEHYRVLVNDSAHMGLHMHWLSTRADRGIHYALDRWLAYGPRRHPRTLLDLNILAHAMFQASRGDEAAEVFRAIGSHPTTFPWDCGGQDPASAFLYARTRALGEPSP